MRRKFFILSISVLIFATSCNRLDVGGMFFSGGTHTEQRVERWLEWDENHDGNVINGVPDSYSFYACSDIHINDNTERLEKFLGGRNRKEKPIVVTDVPADFNPQKEETAPAKEEVTKVKEELI